MAARTRVCIDVAPLAPGVRGDLGGQLGLLPLAVVDPDLDLLDALLLGPRAAGDDDVPESISWRGPGTSMREETRTGAFSSHPRSVQYAVSWSKRVTSSSITHLVAETKP